MMTWIIIGLLFAITILLIVILMLVGGIYYLMNPTIKNCISHIYDDTHEIKNDIKNINMERIEETLERINDKLTNMDVKRE